MLGFYSTCAEKETSEGRIDCVVECPQYVYIMEFKLNGSAEEAVRQIKEKALALLRSAQMGSVLKTYL